MGRIVRESLRNVTVVCCSGGTALTSVGGFIRAERLNANSNDQRPERLPVRKRLVSSIDNGPAGARKDLPGTIEAVSHLQTGNRKTGGNGALQDAAAIHACITATENPHWVKNRVFTIDSEALRISSGPPGTTRKVKTPERAIPEAWSEGSKKNI